MSAKSVVTTVSGFLTHHITDLNNVSDILSELVGFVPIDSQDKDRINSAIETVRDSANNVANFLKKNTVTGGEVVVKQSDIVHAVADYLNSDAGKAALVAAAKSAEGNGA
jgi:vacuolar-type H+-ATPase subunit I/STV1